MGNLPFVVILFRKLGLLALTGFLVVTLIGPILAVLGIMFSFAVIGLVFWLPVRTLILGRPVEWSRYRQMTQKCGRVVVAGCRRVSGGFFDRGPDVLDRVCATGRFLATVFRETMCGALVGALLGLTQVSPDVFFMWPIILGLVGGAVCGAVVGLLSGRRVWETA